MVDGRLFEFLKLIKAYFEKRKERSQFAPSGKKPNDILYVFIGTGDVATNPTESFLSFFKIIQQYVHSRSSHWKWCFHTLPTLRVLIC